MGRRWTMVLLPATGLLACTESLTAPDSRASGSRPLPLPEYAVQLRGDPFLTRISGMLGRPQLINDIDAALQGVDQTGSGSSELTTASVASARLTLMTPLSEDADATVIDTNNAVGEAEVLSAVLTATLDRIAQVNEESAEAVTSPSDPPPNP